MAVAPVRPKLKTAFKIARCIAPLLTAGPVAIAPDGKLLVTSVAERILLTDVASGEEICRFSSDSQTVTALAISPSSKTLAVFTSPQSLRIYEIPLSDSTAGLIVQPTRVVNRAHDAPVHVCKIDPSSTYLASGSADGVVKVFDIFRGYITHVFKGHGGVVSALAFNFHQDFSSVNTETKMQLITASVDTRIRIFDLSATASRTVGALKPEAVLEGHASVPRGLDVSHDGKWLVSGGRDAVVLIWDLASKSSSAPSRKGDKGKGKEFNPTLVKTIPILERVEAVGFLQPDEDLTGSSSVADKRLRFYTGGEKGVIKIWDAREGTNLFTLGHEHKISDDMEEQRQIVDAIYLPSTSTVASIHADQNILFHSLTNQSLTRQLIGFNDEVIDGTFLSLDGTQGPLDSHLALATNSSLIRVYATKTFDTRLLEGHREIVLCLDRDSSGSRLVSGSKDRTARVWAPQAKSAEELDGWGWSCVAVCEGHAESVGAIAMSRAVDGKASGSQFMFTGSQDRTIKMWDLAGVPLVHRETTDAIVKCKSLSTHKAHEKDINALDVSPNNRLLVSGSQDRTAKIYEVVYNPGSGSRPAHGELKLLGTCKGHKRGVWTVRFGRHEKVLATGSGDKTVKLWSLDDFSCVKTFEGHTNSVLRVDFLNLGMQLVSAGSDGLVKVWNVREEECMTTLDNHEDKVWTLAISSDEQTIVSGAADSVVTFWKDSTEEQEAEKVLKKADTVAKEQDFLNYLALQDYRKAIQLAIAMEQPGRLLSLFKTIISSASIEQDEGLPQQPSLTGSLAVDEVIQTLAGSDLAKLLRFVRDWNTNAKTSGVAQTVLHAIVKLRAADDVVAAFGNEKRINDFIGDADDNIQAEEETRGASGTTAVHDLVEGLIPYTERHLARMEKLLQESYIVDYILGEMDDGMFDDNFETDDIMDVDTD